MYHIIHPFKLYNSMVFSLFTELGNHHHNQFQDILITSKRRPMPLAITSYSPLKLPSLWKPLTYFLSLQICLFWTLHTNGIMQYVVFCGWLPLLSMFSRFIHAETCISTSFLFIAKQHSVIYHIPIFFLFYCVKYT